MSVVSVINIIYLVCFGLPCIELLLIFTIIYHLKKSTSKKYEKKAVRSFTGMDRNGPHYRNGLPEWTFICVVEYFSFGF